MFDVVSAADAEKEIDGIWVDCRWVITNKGSVSQSVDKARLVVRELADSKRNDLYAGTPGLNFVKIGLAMATERRCRGDAPNNIMTFDVKTAFLYGHPADVFPSRSHETSPRSIPRP